ncbi:MAG TPA: FIST N-terminal domain-containing protein, partial [Dissulfurispiraceae bacterium]|nr:FIST N-terminal domain-containing protein [Dissulfurispiraceae bacterium]
MKTEVGVGYSVHRNPAEAGKEAAEKAMQQAGNKKPDFVFVFATVGYNQKTLIRAVREATAQAPLSGCSGEGIITPGIADETNFGVAVMTIRSDELQFHHAYATEIGHSMEAAGKTLADGIRDALGPNAIACFVMADGLTFNFDPFKKAFSGALSGLNSALPLIGGLAADNWASKKTYQYHNDEVVSEGIACVLVSGNGRVAWGIDHGCIPIGTERTITRSKANVIYEIDGVPALDALSEYFEEEWKSQWNKTSLNLCLGFKTPDHMKDYYREYIIRYM